jgi:hypothetical protein
MEFMKNNVSHRTRNTAGKLPTERRIIKTFLFIYCFAYGNKRMHSPEIIVAEKTKQIVPTITAAIVGFLLIFFCLLTHV